MVKSFLKFLWRHLPFKLPLLRMVRAAVRLPEQIYRHLHFVGDFKVDVAPGAQFAMRSYAQQVENDLFWSGYAGNWEGGSLDLWRRLCYDAETVLDVGANTGVYALTAAALKPRARVVAFEPVPRVFQRLEANCAMNGGRVRVVAAAVSDRDGVATIYDTDTEHVYSASLDYGMLGHGFSRSYEVPTITLDRYCDSHEIDRVDLVKIDVERHEPAVFRGFRRMLKASRPAILIEVLDDNIGREVAVEIKGLGYCAYAIRDHGADRGLTPAATLGGHGRNYLLCQAEMARGLGLSETEPLN